MKHLPVAILIAVLLAALVLGKYDIAVIVLLAILMRYEIGENIKLRSCVEMWKLRCSLLESELGATEGEAQEVER